MATALWVPNVEFIFGLTGATASVTIAYILPAITYMRLLPSNLTDDPLRNPHGARPSGCPPTLPAHPRPAACSLADPCPLTCSSLYAIPALLDALINTALLTRPRCTIYACGMPDRLTLRTSPAVCRVRY